MVPSFLINYSKNFCIFGLGKIQTGGQVVGGTAADR